MCKPARRDREVHGVLRYIIGLDSVIGIQLPRLSPTAELYIQFGPDILVSTFVQRKHAYHSLRLEVRAVPHDEPVGSIRLGRYSRTMEQKTGAQMAHRH
jgi:hypothetical protein